MQHHQKGKILTYKVTQDFKKKGKCLCLFALNGFSEKKSFSVNSLQVILCINLHANGAKLQIPQGRNKYAARPLIGCICLKSGQTLFQRRV